MDKPQAKIKLSALELIEKTLRRRSEDIPPGNDFNFDVKVDSRVNPDQKLIIVIVDIDVRYFGNDIVLGHIGFGCGFEIENFDDVITKQSNGQYQIPTDVDTLTKTVSLSTVRGVIYSEFRGTYLSNANLPIILINPPMPLESQKSEIPG